MRRYFRHILLSLISVICTVSCIKELDDPNPVHVSDTPTVLVPRVKSFTNQYITKAGYESNEKTISSLAVLIFNENGEIVNIQESEETSSITLNKSMLGSPEHRDKLSKATVVMFANIDIDNVKNADGNSIKDIKELSELEDYICHFEAAQTVITKIDDTFKGFPMIGQKEVNLTPTRNSQAAEEIPLKILYAKINFEISVTNGTENTGSGMRFTLKSYSVHNISKATKLNDITTTSDATVSSDYSYKSGDTTDGTGNTITLLENNLSTLKDNSKVKFTFYVAESRYNHNSDLKGIYPSDDWLTTDDTEDGQVQNGVKSFYDDLIQQYKPKLANVSTGEPAAGLASYVLLNGTYVDYRGTSWNVDYTVYLGKDNAQNFHVDRNSEYTNYITIKGIRNNDSYIDRDDEGNITSDQHVWIDHRVNVSTTDPSGHVAITRETLIDSHIEVRPLRVSWPEGKYDGVRVYLPTTENNGTTLLDWIGMERFTGENCDDAATYCYSKVEGADKSISTGKRKYFTDGLIEELQTKDGIFDVQTDAATGKKFVDLLNGECVWIYFDENTGTKSRPAAIDLQFYKKNSNGNETITYETYSVVQAGLETVIDAGRTYSFESYEEYLHSYDSYDTYNLSTSYVDYTKQGIAWGYPDYNFSTDIIVVAAELYRGTDRRYDYFHVLDEPSGDTYYSYLKNGDAYTLISTGKGLDATSLGAGTGIDFTNRASAKVLTHVNDMGTPPTSAYQYCLSKNKFNVDSEGNVSMKIKWYLPDAYEMQTVLGKISSSADYLSGANYWTSQPAFDGIFTQNVGAAREILDEARAVSNEGISNVKRTTKNRIRCLYNETGIVLDEDAMGNRTPSGIGGNNSFVMKAHDANQAGHYNYMLDQLISNTDTEGSYGYENASYLWPTFSKPGNDFGYLIGLKKADGTTVNGFSENPADKSSWEENLTAGISTGYYTTLATFPGLSKYKLDKQLNAEAYKPNETLRTEVKVEVAKKRNQIEKYLTTLDKLDEKLNIVFDSGMNAKNQPKYRYSIHQEGSQTKTTTRYWDVPTYKRVCLDPSNPVDINKEFEGISDKQNIWNMETAKNQAYERAKQKAQNEYPDCIYSYGEPTYTESYSSFMTKVQVTCKVNINVSNYYYEDAVGGGWNDNTADEDIEIHSGLEYDELDMYSGNSFTVSVSDPDYVITKVTVHYSGDNLMVSYGTGKADKIYARFVESSVELPTTGTSTPMQLVGMEYSADGISGWQQWSGQGKESVTMELKDYVVIKHSLNQTYTYMFRDIKTNGTEDDSNLTKYIVIDKIEVKCTKKSTAEQ